MSSVDESAQGRPALSGFQEFTKPVFGLPRSSPCRKMSGACTEGRLGPTVQL